ncbi:DUF2207 domain-containing protein [uncultured Fusobacterium sp.]|uniref:DUF2207 family protein n=1 Tax=uncultured Fusobacterium sp. TaxID=159267 RepID=UPI0015A70683|nr:DUF2207 domain-containing protein [uncultured Fusobacterium sp.]
MKKFKISFKKILISIFISFISISIYGEPSYRIDNLRIEAYINPDGSVDVNELVQYNAYNINGILYNIDYKGYGDLKNLRVFYEKDSEFVPAINNNSQRKGTYSLKDSDNLGKIKLYYPMRNTRKWFLFQYKLSQGVTVYNDIAQFNRKMVGKGWQTDIENIQVKIILPKEVSKEDIKAFGHGPLTGNVDIISGREILYTLKGYYSGEFVETNVLFPKSLIPNINPSLVRNENGYEKIINMENKLADKADRERKFAENRGIIGNIVFFLWSGWIIFVVGLNYVKNRKKHKVENEYGEYFREAPDDFSPAVGGAIAYKYVSPSQLLATVMDLVRRDIFEMIEDRENNKTILRKNSYDERLLKNYEKFVVDWYIDEIGNGVEVSMEEIEENIRDRRNAIKFGRNYEKWESMVEKDLKKVGFEKEPVKKLPKALGMITAFLSIPLGPFLAAYFDNRKFIIFTFVAFAMLNFTISTRGKYTLEAEKLRAKWLAFKKFLVDYSNLEEAKLASIYIWEHYFVYAIALGVAEEVAKGYQKIFRDSGENISRLNRAPIMGMYSRNSGFRNIERTVSKATTRGRSELAKSRSSSRGSGGGFSGGSSGGGGSRGGGGAF